MPRKRTPASIAAITGRGGVNSFPSDPGEFAVPDAPAFLTKRARDAWGDLAEMLHGVGVLTNSDALALGMLCEAFSDWQEASDAVQAEGATYRQETETGKEMIRAHPAVAQRADAWRRLQSSLGDFGLTPSAREAIMPGGRLTPEDDIAAKYFL